jgi:hypothetical protein
MNILGDFYLIMMKRIEDKMPEVKHIDYFNDQISEEDEESPIVKPSALFEFPPAEVISLGKRKEAWNQTFRVHISSNLINEMDKRTKPDVRDRALAKHLTLIDSFHKHFQNYTGADQGVLFGSIRHVSTTLSHNFDSVITHVVEFFVRIENTVAMRKMVHIAPPAPALNLTVTIEEL